MFLTLLSIIQVFFQCHFCSSPLFSPFSFFSCNLWPKKYNKIDFDVRNSKIFGLIKIYKWRFIIRLWISFALFFIFSLVHGVEYKTQLWCGCLKLFKTETTWWRMHKEYFFVSVPCIVVRNDAQTIWIWWITSETSSIRTKRWKINTTTMDGWIVDFYCITFIIFWMCCYNLFGICVCNCFNWY